MAVKHEVSTLSLGRTQTVHNMMQIVSQDTNDRFNRLYKLHNIVQDPTIKASLQEQMLKLVSTPSLTYVDAEKQIYKDVVDVTKSDSDEEAFVDMTADDVAYDDDDGESAGDDDGE